MNEEELEKKIMNAIKEGQKAFCSTCFGVTKDQSDEFQYLLDKHAFKNCLEVEYVQLKWPSIFLLKEDPNYQELKTN